MIELYVFIAVFIISFIVGSWTNDLHGFDLHGFEKIWVPICLGAMGFGFTGIIILIINHVRIV